MKKDELVLFVVVAVLIIGSALFLSLTKETAITPQDIIKTETGFERLEIPTQSSAIKVPAVDNEGNGVSTTLLVEAIPGKGRVLTNINQLLFWVDTQYSIRTAENVAQNITKIDLTNIDLIYTIETNASIIEGPSAGAALTVATIATLQNKTINPTVMITGTINPDGSVGPVGGILAKAKASKDVGATLFLVPKGQSIQTNYVPVRQCQDIGPINYCSIEYKQERIDITKEAGITVKEVSTIDEALKYFLV